jgi:hypothetical protein
MPSRSRRFTLARSTPFGRSACCAALLLLAGAVPTFAQAVAPKDLVGSWARQGEKQPYATFRADQTVTMMFKGVQIKGDGVARGRWRLAGDTLFLTGMIGKLKGHSGNVTTPPRLVAMKDRRLTITRLDHNPDFPKTQVYEPVADSLQSD